LKIPRMSLDSLGVCASTLCMIHCLVFPFLLMIPSMWIAATPEANAGLSRSKAGIAVPMKVTSDEVEGCREDCCTASDKLAEGGEVAGCCSTPFDFWVHVGLLATVVPMGAVAWAYGFRQHRDTRVLWLGAAGTALLCAALTVGNQIIPVRGEQVMTICGSVCLISAHLLNRRQCRCCRDARCTDNAKQTSPAPVNLAVSN